MSRTANDLSLAHYRVKFVLLALMVLAAILATPALAQDDPTVSNAKRAGIIGEMADGYIGFRVGDVPADVRAAVNNINIKRRAAYQDLANKGGITIQVAGALTAEKLIARASKGEYVRLGDGTWKQVQ